MKNNIVYFVWVIIVFNYCIINQSCSQTMKELKFSSRVKNNSTIDDFKIQASLKVDTVQKMSNNGLGFSVKLKNCSNDSVTIKNPLDFFHINLINNRGQDIFIKIISRYVINIKSGTFSYTSFKIDRVKINGAIVNMNLDKATHINIPAQGTFEIFLRIINVFKNNETGSVSSDQIAVLDKGRYQLLVNLSIVKGEWLTTLNLDPVMINYK